MPRVTVVKKAIKIRKEPPHTREPWVVHIPKESFRSLRHLGIEGGDTGIEILAILKNEDGSTGGYQTVVGHANCQPHLRILTGSDAKHIVSCVNALAGLNPSAIAGLVEAAEEMARALRHLTNNALYHDAGAFHLGIEEILSAWEKAGKIAEKMEEGKK